jgi:hypothetical protein
MRSSTLTAPDARICQPPAFKPIAVHVLQVSTTSLVTHEALPGAGGL